MVVRDLVKVVSLVERNLVDVINNLVVELTVDSLGVVVVVALVASTPLNLKRYLCVIAIDVIKKRWPADFKDGAIFIALPRLLHALFTSFHFFSPGIYLNVFANGIRRYLGRTIYL